MTRHDNVIIRMSDRPTNRSTTSSSGGENSCQETISAQPLSTIGGTGKFRSLFNDSSMQESINQLHSYIRPPSPSSSTTPHCKKLHTQTQTSWL
eukprot:scaffold1931_cov77-Cylindrotheca_fusiformis.AAC.6